MFVLLVGEGLIDGAFCRLRDLAGIMALLPGQVSGGIAVDALPRSFTFAVPNVERQIVNIVTPFHGGQ